MSKGVPDYDNKSKDCNILWLMEEPKKITAGVDAKSNPWLYIIKQLISFVTMHTGPTETNDEYLYRFNYQQQNLILSGGNHNICCLKTMDKVGETATTEEVTKKYQTLDAMLFLLNADESIYGKLFEDLRKAAIVGRYEYTKTINGAYELLVHT